MSMIRTHSNPPLRTTLSFAVILILLSAICVTAFSAKESIADDSGMIELLLESDLPQLSEDNPAYSLEGACFGVYSDYQCLHMKTQLETDEWGWAYTDSLPAGRYFVRQMQASRGFAVSDRLYQADVAVGGVATIEASATPNYSAPNTIIQEFNAETGKAAGCAGAKLGSAKYAISYYSRNDGTTILAGPMRTWTFTSDAKGQVRLSKEYLVDGSPLFCGSQDMPVLPIGHYTVSMEEAPVGYEELETPLAFDIVDPGDYEIDPICKFNVVNVGLQVIRGDLTFRKVDENNKPLSGIPFLLSYANGEDEGLAESHVIVTDENGDFYSDAARVLHSTKTNANDDAVTPIPGGSYSLDESMILQNTGTWFSLDTSKMSAEPNDLVGALPYGSYTLQELPCTTNEGMNLGTIQFSVYRDGYTTALDNIVGTVPAITSQPADAEDGNVLMRPECQSRILDTVSYRNLVVGKSYTLTSTVMSKDTGETLQTLEGDPACVVTRFTPAERDGKLIVELEVDTSGLAGRQIMVYEELVSEDGMVIAATYDDEAGQLLEVEPIIYASAHDYADKDKYAMGADAIIIEHIDYEGLKPGTRYVADAILNDKATGSTVRDSQGQVIDASVEFVAETSSGSVDMELPVDTTGIAGHDLVVFDRMSDENGATIASHQDIENADQTIKTVKLSTSAVDKEDGDKLFDGRSHSVTIVDTVKYANLTSGEQYELHGVLMDKETGTALSNGSGPVRAVVPFVPKDMSGSVDVEFTFDAEEQTSEVLVAFETLMHDGNVVAEHADLEDVAQTVTSEELEPDPEPEPEVEAKQEPPASTIEPQVLGAEFSGKAPKTGDNLSQAIGLVLVMAALSTAGIAYAAHRRRHTIETIARSSELKK